MDTYRDVIKQYYKLSYQEVDDIKSRLSSNVANCFLNGTDLSNCLLENNFNEPKEHTYIISPNKIRISVASDTKIPRIIGNSVLQNITIINPLEVYSGFQTAFEATYDRNIKYIDKENFQPAMYYSILLPASLRLINQEAFAGSTIGTLILTSIQPPRIGENAFTSSISTLYIQNLDNQKFFNLGKAISGNIVSLNF